MKFTSAIIILALAISTSARPVRRQAPADVQLQNGKDTIALNDKFAGLNADSPCAEGDQACINNGFAQCVAGKFVIQPCPGGTVCKALPLLNSAGTTISCTTQADFDQRIAASGASAGDAQNNAGANPNDNKGKGGNNNNKGGNNNAGNGKNATAAATTSSAAAAASATANAGKNATAAAGGAANAGANANNGDPQKSLTLDPKVIAKGFANNGQDQPAAGQVASLTSTNNFINFCLTSGKPLTDGKQVKGGSCNPAPMGIIAAATNIPSCKFQSPPNMGEVEANKAFTIKLQINHLETGHFTNAEETYFAAPQQVNKAGDIQGHSHVVIEKLTSLTQTTPTDPGKFAFFKGLNAGGNPLTADVTNGLDEGAYRLCSINTAANHQPALVAVAQHGSVDDCIYFTSKKGAKN
ncbi:hypothetical protein QCA50_001402 [Cerrena zonata]|uniref:Carbohydrate-binding module family 19 domain-containing protein n=1 Tax=Cerrena zonata TaxID=2478898 RepID=A0AAW0GNJ2_9APHY